MIVVELVWIVTIQLPQNLDDVGIRIGTTEGISRAIETQNELFRLRRVKRLSVRHCEYRKKDMNREARKRQRPMFGGPEQLSLCRRQPTPSTRSQSYPKYQLSLLFANLCPPLAEWWLHRGLQHVNLV